jgi:hypothetical protein
MRIIGTMAQTLQSALGAALDAIGRRTGAIRRRRKFAGASLLKTVVLTVLKSPKAQTDDFVATAAQLGVTVTPQAVEKRFTGRLVAFLRAGLGHVLEHAVVAEPAAIPLLERFSAVEIRDSTTVTVPDDYADEFPGCHGKSRQRPGGRQDPGPLGAAHRDVDQAPGRTRSRQRRAERGGRGPRGARVAVAP